jgi:hypothetical protein
MVKVWLKVCLIAHWIFISMNIAYQVYHQPGAREKEILELVHSVVFVHVHVPSLGKSMYYILFINHFLRNTWIYFLQNKSKVFGKFKEFKILVENMTEKKISVLGTDNGGELYGNKF